MTILHIAPTSHFQIRYTIAMIDSTMMEFLTILASILGGTTLQEEAQMSSMAATTHNISFCLRSLHVLT